MSATHESRLPIPVEELLQHAGWLRGLAASLVGDPARADDLVQETWLATLKRPPLAGPSPRPWLERVFRNLARNRRRAEHTRAEHETRVEGRYPSPSPDEIAQEVETQRLLAEAVGRLPDPARTIVVLRYFRGLDASAIGRELALPAGTVRWKLKAALEELRRELDRRFEGGRKAWSLALGRLLAAEALPASTISIQALAAGAAVLVVAAVGWWSLRRGGGEEVALASVAQGGLEQVPTFAPPLLARSDAAGAEPSIGTARAPLESLVEPRFGSESEPDITGSVLVDGAPPARPVDLELELLGSFESLEAANEASAMRRSGPALKRKLSTDDSGRFAIFAAGIWTNFTLRAPAFLLEDEGEEWRPMNGVTPARGLMLHLRTPPRIRGRVVTQRGQPVAGAHGVYDLSAEPSGWYVESGSQELDCDGDGRFEIPLLDVMFEEVPKFLPGETCTATLVFEVPRSGRCLLETDGIPPTDFDLGDLVLEPVRVVAFVVRDEHGAPLSGAVARLDDHWLTKPSSATNREGRGELRCVPDREVRLRFSALGYADRVLAVGLGDQPNVWLEPATLLEVQLEPPANTYGPFPEIVLQARAALLERLDVPQPGVAFDLHPIQTELGASPSNGHGHWSDENGMNSIAHWLPDTGGRVLIVGLRPDVAFTLEARDVTGRALARRELVLGAGERRRLTLPYGE
jgi:RNA polymerase sigma-70 factor (ECF subfamily)